MRCCASASKSATGWVVAPRRTPAVSTRAIAPRSLAARRGAAWRQAAARSRSVVRAEPEERAQEAPAPADAGDAPAQRDGETVVGVEGGVVPQRIIDAERAANPLRRPRLLVYCLAACVAAAQVRSPAWALQTLTLTLAPCLLESSRALAPHTPREGGFTHPADTPRPKSC
jgi:hypothetical protein